MFIESLFIYPLKSARGIELQASEVTPRGLAYDRTLMLVDPDGRFVTQREYPALAQITCQIDESSIIFSAPSHAPIQIAWTSFTSDNTRLVSVWKSSLAASTASPDIDQWFSSVLKASVHLVYQRPDQIRQTKQERAPGGIVSFADGYPVLFTNAASLTDLNTRISERGGEPVPMDRFRPNIVLSGLAPWAEDAIQQLHVNGTSFDLIRPCTRCKITTQDQVSGVRDGKEPLATLARFRHAPAWEGVVFGENGYSQQTGHIAVGDAVTAHGIKDNLVFRLRP